MNSKYIMALANYAQAFKGQEHNRDMGEWKRAKWNLWIKYTIYIYTIYTCIISLDGINSTLDTGEVKISELQANLVKADFLN